MSGVAEMGDTDGKTRSSDTKRLNKTQQKLIEGGSTESYKNK